MGIIEQLEARRKALTAQELAEVLGVSDITLYKMAKSGRIPSFRIGTAVRFDGKAVAAWLRQH